MNMGDGGPAFPCTEMDTFGNPVSQSGISARDYFAAAALQAVIASERYSHLSPEQRAAVAYEHADCMKELRI